MQSKTAAVNSTVQCYNQGTMLKVKNIVKRLCCYSCSN